MAGFALAWLGAFAGWVSAAILVFAVIQLGNRRARTKSRCELCGYKGHQFDVIIHEAWEHSQEHPR